MKFLIAALCLTLLASSALAEENATVEANLCTRLNQQRSDMQDCCDYPRIHFFEIFSTHCIDECVGTKDVCCAMICIWRNTKVTFYEGGIHLDGLKETLLESVTHKEEWAHLVHKAVDQCDSEAVLDETDKLCNMSVHLSGIVNCAIKKLFLMCPNMHNSAKCATTAKYVEECL